MYSTQIICHLIYHRNLLISPPIILYSFALSASSTLSSAALAPQDNRSMLRSRTWFILWSLKRKYLVSCFGYRHLLLARIMNSIPKLSVGGFREIIHCGYVLFAYSQLYLIISSLRAFLSLTTFVTTFSTSNECWLLTTDNMATGQTFGYWPNTWLLTRTWLLTITWAPAIFGKFHMKPTSGH